jgi:hypothetical protein
VHRDGDRTEGRAGFGVRISGICRALSAGEALARLGGDDRFRFLVFPVSIVVHPRIPQFVR